MLGKLKISVIKWYVLILTVNSTGWMPMYKSQATDSIISFAVLFYTLKCPASILFCKKDPLLLK